MELKYIQAKQKNNMKLSNEEQIKLDEYIERTTVERRLRHNELVRLQRELMRERERLRVHNYNTRHKHK